MSYSTNLPPIKLIPLEGKKPLSLTTSDKRPPTSTDIRWLKVQEFLRSVSLAPNSRKLYERELRRFLAWSELGYHELRTRHLAHYKEYLAEEVSTDKGKPLAKSSINAALGALKSFFHWLRDTYPDIIEVNPMAGVKFEKLPLPSAQDLAPSEVEQVRTALNNLGETKLRDTALVHILCHGLRASEVTSLNIGNYDGKLLYIENTKDKKPRLVPLVAESRKAVETYIQHRSDEGEQLHEDNPLLLSYHNRIPQYTRINNPEGARLSYHGIYFAITKLGELAQLPNLHPHAFRHTFATQLLIDGMDPIHVKTLTGHESERAFRRYVVRAKQAAAIAAFDKIHEQ